ncbi:carotenoid ester lipase, partial [Coprinopsis sp. MPI-PUGE-AT-0042]
MLPFLLLSLALGALAQNPTVRLDQATVTGTRLDGKIDKFLGIPFAQPPVGDLRFRLPVKIDSYNESFDATQYGDTKFATLFQPAAPTPQDEDCLTLNVVRPAGIAANASLPVLVWIYGGGFAAGSTVEFDGIVTSVVNRSIALEKPVVLVSINYRVNAFGFLASQEVADEGTGNFGLQDQREALRWIQRYIGAFGGNSSHVTMWGESAGAISAGLQMVANNGTDEGLFHAAFMQSGAPVPLGDLTGGQPYYDDLVNATGCSGQNDTLSCLRSVPIANLTEGINQSPGIFAYQSVAIPWAPRADGTFLTDNPQRLVEADKVVHIPTVCGGVDDEGTLFAGSTVNVTTDTEFETYVKTIFFPDASEEDLEPLWKAYPSNTSEGSPFDTLYYNAVTPQFKRMAAFQGDVLFQAPKRFFLQHQAGKQPTWSYCELLTSRLGFHASDLVANFLHDYLIQFANEYDPNVGGADEVPEWPQYTKESPNVYTFSPAFLDNKIEITQDTFREAGMTLLSSLSLRFPMW